MKTECTLGIDQPGGRLIIEEGADEPRIIDLYSPEAFEIISELWLKVGWDQKYVYGFSWMGRPVIQLPEDMIRMQEVIYRVKPDVIVETGVAHGGGMAFYASICKAMGHGLVIGVELELRPHNAEAIRKHELYGSYMTYVEGSSVAPKVVEHIRNCVHGKKTLVILDSNHTKSHVSAELAAYAPMVTPGSYIVACDGSMVTLADVPRAQVLQEMADTDWRTDNPKAAAEEFAAAHPEFVLEEPAWPFNESRLTRRVTHWPSCFLRRL